MSPNETFVCLWLSESAACLSGIINYCNKFVHHLVLGRSSWNCHEHRLLSFNNSCHVMNNNEIHHLNILCSQVKTTWVMVQFIILMTIRLIMTGHKKCHHQSTLFELHQNPKQEALVAIMKLSKINTSFSPLMTIIPIFLVILIIIIYNHYYLFTFLS